MSSSRTPSGPAKPSNPPDLWRDAHPPLRDEISEIYCASAQSHSDLDFKDKCELGRLCEI